MSISVSVLEQLFRHASDAMVVCRLDDENEPSAVELGFLNPSALTLLGLDSAPATGTLLAQILPDQTLYTHLACTRQTGESTLGYLTQSTKRIGYEINPLGDWLTIRLQAARETEALPTALGRHILAINHLAVAVLDPVVDSQNQLVDFRLAALYDTDSHLSTWYQDGIPVGQLLSEWNPESKTSGLFARYKGVMEGDPPFRAEHYYKGLDTAFDIAASRFGHQLLLTFNRTTETYRAKQQVEEQAALLDAIMQSTQDYITVYQCVRDESGGITDFRGVLCSDVSGQLSGLSKDGIRQTPFKALETTPDLFDQYRRLVETGMPLRMERILTGQEDGITRWLDVSASKVLDGFVSIGKDITSYKRTLKEVETQSQTLETILNNSDSFIYLAESIRNEAGEIVDFRIARSNEAGRQNMIRTVGYDGTGSNLLTLYPFSREQGLFAQYVKVVETGEPLVTDFYYEYQHIQEWMKISAQKMEDGLVVTYVDVSEGRRIAEKAEKYAQQLKGVLDASLNGIILLEAMRDDQGEILDFRYLLANQAASRINNVPLDELIGNTLLTLFPSSRTEGSFPQNVYALTTGNPIRKQLKLYCDRMEGWYDFTSNRINANNLVVSFTDITETKLLEERQRKLVDELRRSNENLQEFAYVASHDLQEPLRKITSFGNILKKTYATALGDEGADLIDRMESASTRMSMLIHDLLAYSRLTTKLQALQPQPLSRVVGEVLSVLDMAIQEKQARVEVDELFVVPGDATQLAQLFQNVLTNALKFTRPGIRPHIQIRSQTVARQQLPTNVDRHTSHAMYGLVQVIDNGIGFDSTEAERIFGAFQRLHGRGKYPGTGIGLAIVKKVVENHSGYILAEGRPNEGATFSIYLPLADAL
ncbi:PAS domain-containing protein [Spirosoma taeanense]|uniref:histidine kinase n=1 Tax=Spirosoma taeanense TaxID=2735870 RepID=A0A6M5YAD4_9BACT|nr:ATP-binding protein [Spirosoma taeanense]QJW91157.1 PAS domain-containing protein [Spirosoma taeanense]